MLSLGFLLCKTETVTQQPQSCREGPTPGCTQVGCQESARPRARLAHRLSAKAGRACASVLGPGGRALGLILALRGLPISSLPHLQPWAE